MINPKAIPATDSSPRPRLFRLEALAFLAVVAAAPWSTAVRAADVAPVFATGAYQGSNADSCAVWVAPDADESLLFVTEKDRDRVEVWYAATGAVYSPRPFLGGPLESSAPGEFDRPNGVWVLHHVPHAGGFSDVLLVTDQENLRVQVFRLPQLEYFGEFGRGEVGKGYGISWYHDGTDFFVYITDSIPPAAFPGMIKKYRLRPEGSRLGADLLFGAGSSTGTPPLENVESILADPFHNRLHVCGDEGGDLNYLFRIDGSYTGVTYGGPQFQGDQEGINLYDTGGGRGYILISDQITGGDPNQFELYDRVTLATLGNFRSPPAAALVTRNTDGAYLEQRPLPGFPDGAFYAVNNDQNTHAYDWTAVAEAMGLVITPLDRPFPGRTEAGAAGHGRNALWHHDGSWWGALPRAEGLTISRLEDGTFVFQQTTALEAAEAEAAPAAGDLLVLSAGGTPRLERFTYDAPRRRYVTAGESSGPEGAAGPLVTLARETGDGDDARAWLAWIGSGEVLAARSSVEAASWKEPPAALGAASPVLPRLIRLEGAIGLLWARPGGGVAFRRHADEGGADSWSAAEDVSATAVASLAAAALPDGRVIAAGAAASGEAAVWLRDAGGGWTGQPLAGPAIAPAILVDARGQDVFLVHGADVAGHRLIQLRRASLADLAFGGAELFIAWPGVDLAPPLTAASLPAAAEDIVAAAMGDDGLGYFSRRARPAAADVTSPITLQHAPPPGTAGLPAGTAITFRITDAGAGVDRSSLRLLIDGMAVTPVVRGVPGSYLVRYPLPAGRGPTVNVRIEASDRALPPNRMQPFEYQLFLRSEKGMSFRRGDEDGDGTIDIADPVRLLLAVFGVAAPAACLDAGDADDDGRRSMKDAIALLAFLFGQGEAPPPPLAECGSDPTPDGLGCDAAACEEP